MSKSLEELIEEIRQFNKVRGWNPEPIDLAKSIVIEAAELLEHFQWDESDKGLKGDEPKNWEEISEEVADVFVYLASFCSTAKLDLAEAVDKKIRKNEKKYPAEMFQNGHNDKFYRTQKKKYRQARQ